MGALLAAGMTQVMQGLLYEVNAWNPTTFFAVSALLAVVALVASALPARRATSIDPMVALRAE